MYHFKFIETSFTRRAVNSIDLSKNNRSVKDVSNKVSLQIELLSSKETATIIIDDKTVCLFVWNAVISLAVARLCMAIMIIIVA